MDATQTYIKTAHFCSLIYVTASHEDPRTESCSEMEDDTVSGFRRFEVSSPLVTCQNNAYLCASIFSKCKKRGNVSTPDKCALSFIHTVLWGLCKNV